MLPKQNWKVDKFEKAKTWSHVWLATQKFLRSVYGLTQHSVKSVGIRSFSGLYFLAFGQNTEIYSAYLRMQPECGKLQTRKTPNTKTFSCSARDLMTTLSKWHVLFSMFQAHHGLILYLHWLIVVRLHLQSGDVRWGGGNLFWCSNNTF